MKVGDLARVSIPLKIPKPYDDYNVAWRKALEKFHSRIVLIRKFDPPPEGNGWRIDVPDDIVAGESIRWLPEEWLTVLPPRQGVLFQ